MILDLYHRKDHCVINDHHSYFEIYGSKTAKPVVLLHHGLGSSQSWTNQISSLVDAGWQVILYDRWGYGESQPRSSTYPTLVIQGLDDEHATSRHALDLAASIDRAEVWLVPGVGHMVPQEFPEQFNEKVLSFLEQKCLTKF